MNESTWQPPSWMYRETRPPNDDAYFENLTRTIFQAGLSWKMISKKWPNFQKAFANFSIDKVAKFDVSDLERLMNDKGIVRNRKKIEATIFNAQEFQKIKKESESFQAYLDGLDKSEDYALVIKSLSTRFQRVGPSTARIFLYSVGENVSHPD
ncbi:MAG: DNA-3-methyladenine glycosylase I [Candidatus Heimdallarchaeota archaeon]